MTLTGLVALSLAGQSPRVTGRVVSAADGGPIAEARIKVLRSGIVVRSSASGTFTVSATVDDSLQVVALGYAPDTLAIEPGGFALRIVLRPLPVGLQDLIGTAVGTALAASDPNTWSVSSGAVRVLPAAVEPDVNRTLALIPGISFSSLLSARPMMRGLDADDGGFAIDGFEAINLYHLGRFFSAVPSLAIDHADVRFQPTDLSTGGSTSGSVNLVGRTGDVPGGDLQYGLGALSAAVSTGGATPIVAAGRTIHLTGADLASSGADVNYSFQDFYANARRRIAGAATEFTLFASSDQITPKVGLAASDSVRMDWSNLVLGARSTLHSDSAGSVVVSASLASHDEQGTEIPARNAELDVTNHLRTIQLRLDITKHLSPAIVFRYGAELEQRNIINRLLPDSSATFLATAQSINRGEGAVYQEIAWRSGPVHITLGAREDFAGSIAAVSPRVRIAINPDGPSWIALTVGRSVRTFDLVSDSRAEPKIAYYDIWLAAGTGGIPAAVVDHVTLDAARKVGAFRLRAGVYAAHGTGEADLYPVLTNADSGSIFRFGSVRLAGLDASAIAGATDGTWSVAANYSYTVSQRNWGQGWVPWLNDRRQQLGVFGSFVPRAGVRLAATAQVSSALPFTPYVGWFVAQQPSQQSVVPVLGAENSSRGEAWLRVDASLTRAFRGPLRSNWEVGLSVSNLSIGDQVARKPILVQDAAGRLELGSAPLFHLPAIPSLVLRGHWAPH